jgi:hypothetical protein
MDCPARQFHASLARADVEEKQTPGTEAAGHALSNFLSVVTLGLFVVAAKATYRVWIFHVRGWPTYLIIAASVALLVSGGILFHFRRVRGSRSLAVLEILVGCAGGILSLFVNDNPLTATALIGYFLAGVSVADGFTKFRGLTEKALGQLVLQRLSA